MSTDEGGSRAWKKSYRHWLLLQQSVVGRVSDYFERVGELVGEGSTQPREWVEGYTDFWSGVIADVGDWVQRESGETLRPSAEWVRRCHVQLQQRIRCTTVPIDVPLAAFRNQNSPRARIALVIGGLVRAGKGELLAYGEHLRLDKDFASIRDRRRELKIFDLPPLRVGDVYSGVVWAKETKSPVATIELEIV